MEYARRSPLTGSNEGNHSKAGSSRNGILSQKLGGIKRSEGMERTHCAEPLNANVAVCGRFSFFPSAANGSGVSPASFSRSSYRNKEGHLWSQLNVVSELRIERTESM